MTNANIDFVQFAGEVKETDDRHNVHQHHRTIVANWENIDLIHSFIHS